MDIVLINGVNFSEDNTEPQLGLIALKKVLNETFNVDIINFDTLYNQKKFFYTDDVNENIQEMAEYICRLNPRIASFYTMLESGRINHSESDRNSQFELNRNSQCTLAN